MRIVIDIPDSLYENILICWENIHPKVWKILKDGTVLPKGHGRLIDADKIESTLHNKAFDLAGSKRFYEINWAHKMVCDAPTIIEADKEVENDD